MAVLHSSLFPGRGLGEVAVLYFRQAYYIWHVKITRVLALFISLLVMLYISVGQMGGVYIGINEAQKEARNASKEYLSTLTITAADLSSGRASFTGKNEILYNGNLYDIAKMNRQADKWILKVFHDEKEEGLLANLKDIVESWTNVPMHNGKHPAAKQMVIIKDYIPAAKISFCFNPILQQVFSVNYSHPSEAPLLSVLKSPPQFV